MLKKAIVFMLISALAFAFLNAIVKSLLRFNVYQIVFFRSIGTLFFTIPFLLSHKISIYGNKKILLVARGIVGVTSMIFFFISLKYLTMGSAVSIRYTSPIFAAFLALFLLKEKIKHVQWLFFIIAFGGVVIIKGFDNNTNSLGLLYAILSAVFSGFVYIAIRKIGDRDHPVVIVNYFMIISAIIGGILSIDNWIMPVGIEWFWLFSLGVFGYFAQLYMTKALQGGKLNLVAPLKYLEVIFTIVIGLIWLSETYSYISLLGISLIIIGLTLNVFIGKKN